MGYLDKQSRVIDIVLTERGRRLYAAGELEFSYFGLFDDGIDYSPYSTGTLSEEERLVQIESTPMMEPTFVRDVRGVIAPLEPASNVFTAAPGYNEVPHMVKPTGDSLELSSDQRRDGGTYSRTGTSVAQIDLKVSGDTERGNPGFLIRVFSSGTEGLHPLILKRDLAGRRAFDPFVAVAVDDEKVPDIAKVDDPSTRRIGSSLRSRKG